MPAKIRLARHGRKRRAFYYIVVADGRAPRDGKFIERIGDYNPNTNPATINLDFDKALDWLSKGAQPTDTMRTILSDEGVMYKKHLMGGVKKGAFDETEAEKKFAAWKQDKADKVQAKIDILAGKATDDAKARLEAEKKVNDARAEEYAKKNADLLAEVEAEEAAKKAEAEGVKEEATEEATSEEPKAEEVKAEEPKAEEVKAEPVKKEEPKAEDKKEVKAE